MIAIATQINPVPTLFYPTSSPSVDWGCLFRPKLSHDDEKMFSSGKTGLSMEKYNHFSSHTF